MSKREREALVQKCRETVARFPQKFSNDWLIEFGAVADNSSSVDEIIRMLESSDV